MTSAASAPALDPTTRQALFGVNPWMACCPDVSFNGNWYSLPSKVKRPCFKRFGKGNKIGWPERVGTGFVAQSGAVYRTGPTPPDSVRTAHRTQLNPRTGQTSAVAWPASSARV